MAAFQPTHPSRGATPYIPRDKCRQIVFQPTHPSRGATGEKVRIYGRKRISTHAPLTGCDDDSVTDFPWQFSFQSTHPSRGATIQLGLAQMYDSISIHAPLTGCDPVRRGSLHGRVYFNPRTPHGVRREMYDNWADVGYFNPRTPHGVRHVL